MKQVLGLLALLAATAAPAQEVTLTGSALIDRVAKKLQASTTKLRRNSKHQAPKSLKLLRCGWSCRVVGEKVRPHPGTPALSPRRGKTIWPVSGLAYRLVTQVRHRMWVLMKAD